MLGPSCLLPAAVWGQGEEHLGLHSAGWTVERKEAYEVERKEAYEQE